MVWTGEACAPHAGAVVFGADRDTVIEMSDTCWGSHASELRFVIYHPTALPVLPRLRRQGAASSAGWPSEERALLMLSCNEELQRSRHQPAAVRAGWALWV